MKKRWMWVAAIACVTGLVATGCKKEDKKPDTTGTPTPTDKVAEAPAPAMGAGTLAPASGSSASVDRLLATLPMDSEIVVGVDVGRMRASAILAPLIEQISKMNQGNVGFDMKAECGIDPSATMGVGVFGIKMTGKDSGEVAGAFNGIPKGKIVPCIEKAKAKMEKEGAKVTIDGNFVFITSTKGGKDGQGGIAFIDDNTAVMKFGTSPVDKAALEKMIASKTGDGLTGSAEFMGMIKSTNTGATVWGLVNGNAPMMAKSPVKFKAAFGSIDVTDGVVADGRVRMTTPDEATKTAQMLASQITNLKGMGFADVAEAKVDGNDVRVTVTMTKDHVEKLKQFVGGMLGGMFGAGMAGGKGGMGADPTGGP